MLFCMPLSEQMQRKAATGNIRNCRAFGRRHSEGGAVAVSKLPSLWAQAQRRRSRSGIEIAEPVGAGTAKAEP